MGHSLQPLKTPPKAQESTLEHSESRKSRARVFEPSSPGLAKARLRVLKPTRGFEPILPKLSAESPHNRLHCCQKLYYTSDNRS